MNPFTTLIILGILAIIAEIVLGAATGFELLIIGVVFVIGGGIGMLTNSVMIAGSSVVVLILGYIVFGRSRIKDAFHITTTKTNSDSIIGKQATVVSNIKIDDPGQVKIEGEIWRAESSKKIEKGKKVTIKSISGVTVRVED